MKLALTSTSLALFGFTHSLPSYAEQATVQKRQSGPGGIPFTTFSEDQLIDVTGEYAWVAPGPNDIRGPCPGLSKLTRPKIK